MEEALDDELRFRAPSDLRPRLKVIAKRKKRKYQAVARLAILDFVEKEEKRQAAKAGS